MLKLWYRKISSVFILFFILFSASVFRLYGIKKRGLFWSDEGFFLNATKTAYAAVNFVFTKFFNHMNVPFGQYIIENGGGYINGAKPGHIALEVVSFFVFGVHDYSAMILSAISGIFSVYLVFLIINRLLGRIPGYIAALLLAISPYHVILSRSALTVSTSTFFILLGVYLYLRSIDIIENRKRSNIFLLFAGLSFGYGYSCHYNLFWAICAILIIETLYLLYFARKTIFAMREFKRILILITGILIPILFWQGVFLLARSFLSSSHEKFLLRTYFEQIQYQFLSAGGVSFNFHQLFYYFRFLLENEGILKFLLFLTGCIYLFIRVKENIAYLILLGFSSLPLIMYSLYFYKSPNTIMVVIPFFTMVATFGFYFLFNLKLIKNIRFAKFLPVIIIILTIFSNILSLKNPLLSRSGYRQALGFISQQGNYKHFTSIPPFSVFYLGAKNVYPAERLEFSKAAQLYKEGYRYLILDWNRYLVATENELIAEVLKRGIQPVFSAPYRPFSMLYGNDEDRELLGHSIDVYDLKNLFQG